ncbi:MAG: protein kinase [Pseudomonadota bacterium]
MDKQKKERRDRLVTLAFVSVLMLLVYGPAAQWFVAADRFLFDTFAGQIRSEPLADAVIVSIDPERKDTATLGAEYARLLRIVREQGARRIILPEPPEVTRGETLPDWVKGLDGDIPIFLPTRHAVAARATRAGFLDIVPDNDGVLRQSQFWHLYQGQMTPSLPLAVALANPENTVDPRISSVDDTVFLSRYAPIPRLDGNDVLAGRFSVGDIEGRTVFIDSEPPLVAAAGMLPSGQYATVSEITALLLADVENQRAIVAPTWVKALEWLVPALIAMIAALFLPGRKRMEIVATTLAIIAGLVIVEVLILYQLRIRLDLGRPAMLILGAGLLVTWLSGASTQATATAFRRGSAFLAAGRLEPAFAEFRRCEPNDMLASVMYKLSLAFEEQSKPERAEAVLDWLKRTHGPEPAAAVSSDGVKGVPKRLGRYVIERKLGRGAMGAVYLARDPRINRAVAVKVIPLAKEFEDDELAEARVRFFREAESAGRLTHPNIVTVYDAGEDQNLAYIAMEYLHGKPLTEFTNSQRLLAPNKALELCARTAEALDYAHNQGVIHRDIKPANILYNLRDDKLKISDFGVARMTDNNRTKTGIVLGTPMYMSPEQLSAEDLTGASDLFSLGVTLYELLTGEVPFKAANIAVLMTKITSDDPPPVSNRRSGVPPSVDAVLLKALAKRPQDRFTNGGEMAIALRNCARYAS